MTLTRANLFVMFVMIISMVFSSLTKPVAAQTCQSGERPATEADLPLMEANGYPEDYQKVGRCWNPDSKYYGAEPGEAKQYLRSILCPPDGDNYGGMGPDGTIAKLDGKLAVCAAKFLKASRDAGINVCIREGARTVAKQEQYVRSGVIACKRGAACEHPRGLAIDVNVRPNVRDCASYARLHAGAGRFGLDFYLKCRDAYHFRATGAECSAGGTIPSAGDYDFPQYAPVRSTPTAGLTGQIRQSLGMSTAPQATTPTTQNPLDEQRFCSPQFSCREKTMYYQTSSCQLQVYQQCPHGCAGSACAASSTSQTSSPIGGAFSTSTETTDTSDQAATSSASDALSSYLGGISVSAVDIGTATPISLIAGTIADIGRIREGSVPLSQATTSIISTVQPANSQQTFTSGDLSADTGIYTGQNVTGLQAILSNMRSALEWAVRFLKPFGGIQQLRA